MLTAIRSLSLKGCLTRYALVDEDISFAEWLRRQIDAYLAAKEPKAKRGKGKEA